MTNNEYFALYGTLPPEEIAKLIEMDESTYVYMVDEFEEEIDQLSDKLISLYFRIDDLEEENDRLADEIDKLKHIVKEINSLP